MESLSRWFAEHYVPSYPAAGSTLPGAPSSTPPGVSPGAPPGGTSVVTVIGSGGKTSLIWLLARSLRQRRVLVSPSTKMYPPSPELHYYDYALFGAAEIGATAIGATGITLAGVLKAETGKLEALPPGVLEKTIPAYDLVLLEGDGSRGLPLKGWADHEPVVPPCTTLTIALIPISVLGQKISGETVFRLPQFLALCGAGEGDRISIAHLAALIRGGQGALNGGTARGLLSAARGKKLLFINQAEGRWDEARELAASLPADLSAGLEGIICGSVEQDRVEILR